MEQCEETFVDHKKYYCGRKNKYGLNLQAVCDVRGRFLDVSMKQGGSSSDYVAFNDGSLGERLLEDENGKKKPLFAPNLVLYGDNAYVNTPFMATPYPNSKGDVAKDNYNFFHSTFLNH